MANVRGLRRLGAVVGLAFTAAAAGGCGSSKCTTLGCDDQAVVTYPTGAVSGPYDLVIAGDTDMITARCSDPTAPEAAKNPPELQCDNQGFTLTGHPLANMLSVRVTIVDVASGDTIADAVEVILDAVDMQQPNGPDCAPTCYVRNGRLVL